jgi:hypothetical protein
MGMSKLAADHGNFAGKSISLQPAGARIFSWAGEKGTGERRYDPDNRREPYFGFLRARGGNKAFSQTRCERSEAAAEAEEEPQA